MFQRRTVRIPVGYSNYKAKTPQADNAPYSILALRYTCSGPVHIQPSESGEERKKSLLHVNHSDCIILSECVLPLYRS